MGLFILNHTSVLPESFQKRELLKTPQASYCWGYLTLDRDSKFYPSRSDERVMRTDVIASIIAINTLIEDLDLKPGIENYNLFVSNGSFVEDNQKSFERITNAYRALQPQMNIEEKQSKIYKSIPPLLALETLTNSTMSYIAQYTGFKSHNFTIGNTSISGVHLLNEAKKNLCNNPTSFLISSNCSGDQSYLSNSSLFSNRENWKESMAVGCLIVKNTESKPKEAIAQITKIITSNKVPSLEENKIRMNWRYLIPDNKANYLIFSGAFTKDQYLQDLQYCNQICKKSFSYYPEYGNLGASNIILSVIKAIQLINKDHQIIDVLDRDVFGRESLIRIERC